MTVNISSVRAPTSRPSPVLLYFAGAYAWTWTLNVIKILAQRHIISVPLPFILLDLVAGVGPFFAALAVTNYESGGAGRRALLGQLLHWRVPVRWYVVSVAGPVVLAAAAFALWVLTGGSLPLDLMGQWAMAPVYFAYILVFGGGIGEELGWRGFALPRLQQRYSAPVASVIVGVAWAGWHIPAWFTPGSGQDLISFPVFVASVIASSIIFTSLYNSTGSLPVVILTHTVFDLCTTGPWFRALFTLPPEQRGADPFNLLTALVGIVAVAVLLTTDRRTLTGRRKPASYRDKRTD